METIKQQKSLPFAFQCLGNMFWEMIEGPSKSSQGENSGARATKGTSNIFNLELNNENCIVPFSGFRG